MTDIPDVPNWLAVGNEVVLLRTHRGTPQIVKRVTVTKHTATQIVLENGARYRRKDLSEIADRGPWSGVQITLCSPDDLAVLKAEHEIQVETCRVRVNRRHEEWYKNPTPEAADALASAAVLWKREATK